MAEFHTNTRTFDPDAFVLKINRHLEGEGIRPEGGLEVLLPRRGQMQREVSAGVKADAKGIDAQTDAS